MGLEKARLKEIETVHGVTGMIDVAPSTLGVNPHFSFCFSSVRETLSAAVVLYQSLRQRRAHFGLGMTASQINHSSTPDPIPRSRRNLSYALLQNELDHLCDGG